MHSDIHSLYRELTENLTQENLKEITAKIIDAYRKRNSAIINSYAVKTGLDPESMPAAKLFSLVIQKYHPDKFTALKKELDDHYAQGSYNELLRMHELYVLRGDEEAASDEYFCEEEYSYDDSDFGYAEEEYDEEDIYYSKDEETEFMEPVPEEEEPGHGFIEALSADTFGNLEVMITPGDLMNLDGDLDLSDYHITDLEGIEHCVNVTGLNLSGNDIYNITKLAGLLNLRFLYLSDNDIESISCLAELTSLKEIDISFNNIDDVTVLLDLPELEYVNLIGNPVKTGSVIDELHERGVVIIY